MCDLGVVCKDRHLQMAYHPILRETSKPLSAFPQGLQAGWMTGLG